MKTIALLMLLILISLNLAYLCTLHGDLLRWVRRADNDWGVPAYCAIVAVLVVGVCKVL